MKKDFVLDWRRFTNSIVMVLLFISTSCESPVFTPVDRPMKTEGNESPGDEFVSANPATLSDYDEAKDFFTSINIISGERGRRYPIDLDKALRMGMIRPSRPMQRRDWVLSTGERLKEIQSSYNASLVGKTGFLVADVVMFSERIEGRYSTTENQQRKYYYAKLGIRHITKFWEFDPAKLHLLSQILNEEFIRDVNDSSISHSEFIRKWGTHIEFRVYGGGNIDVSIEQMRETNSSFTEWRGKISSKIEIAGASIGASIKGNVYNGYGETSVLDECKTSIHADGGRSTFTTLTGAIAAYPVWADEVEQNPVPIPPQSLADLEPVWMLIRNINPVRAAGLQQEYIQACYSQLMRLNQKYPFQFFDLTPNYEISFLPGTINDTFTLPKQGSPILIQILMSASGSGGQGHGGCAAVSNSAEHAGGGGGSGSAIVITLISYDGVMLKIKKVGRKGRGSPLWQSPNCYQVVATPGGDGEDTVVDWNNVTFKASAGTGGGYGGGVGSAPNRPNGDNRGGLPGIASITGLTAQLMMDYNVKYTLQDGQPGGKGQNGGYQWGQGGAAPVIGDWVGSTGGRGGGGDGADGEDGKLIIRAWFYPATE